MNDWNWAETEWEVREGVIPYRSRGAQVSFLINC